MKLTVNFTDYNIDLSIDYDDGYDAAPYYTATVTTEKGKELSEIGPTLEIAISRLVNTIMYIQRKEECR